MKVPSGSRMNEIRDPAERHRRRAFPNAHRHEASMLRFNVAHLHRDMTHYDYDHTEAFRRKTPAMASPSYATALIL